MASFKNSVRGFNHWFKQSQLYGEWYWGNLKEAIEEAEASEIETNAFKDEMRRRKVIRKSRLLPPRGLPPYFDE